MFLAIIQKRKGMEKMFFRIRGYHMQYKEISDTIQDFVSRLAGSGLRPGFEEF